MIHLAGAVEGVAQVLEAERALLDFVTFPAEPYDGVLVAAHAATRTTRVGLVPTVTTTHTEPFHVGIGIATLDHVSKGRAGWRVATSPSGEEARLFGRRTDLTDLELEAADAVEVARRLWDSWEDDAEIRDVPTGRFVDRDKLHYIDFEGRWFSVKGPSITPRPPQGQPVVVADAGLGVEADVVLVTPRDTAHAWELADAGTRVFALGATDVETVVDWHQAGIDGFLLPVADAVELAAELRDRGLFRTAYEATTLRGLLGLPRPASRYAEVS
ncbi:LLM class flavin-dependent oxidoreductase [Nonomuraea sp. NPDC050556]|uniref:LLM class flavin-dependent oxidoreductase n=1 Tax=Nonomuraea sp. NPDC050556 TaxID=3364369 RepID=UPI0037A7B86F